MEEEFYIVHQPYYIYADNVLKGKQVACRYIKLACKKFMDFLKREDMYFDTNKVDKVLNFCSKIIQFEDPFNDVPLVLTPWQTFFIANIYGFYWRDKEGNKTDNRVCKHVLLEVGRKAGKSSLCAVLALYHLIIESNGRTEVDCAAMTRKQAGILHKMGCSFAKKLDPRGKYLKQTRDNLKFKINDSFFQCLAAESKRLDGFNSQVFFVDEAAVQENTDLYDVLASSQQARKNPISFILTSANYNLTGPHFLGWRKAAIDMLEGVVQNDSLFALIYTLDEGDDYRDESVWEKSQPNLGITVTKDSLRDRIIQAQSMPDLELDIKTKNFNMYVQSKHIWISDKIIMQTFEKVDLQRLKGELCYGGIDLASVSDLTAVSLMFPPNEAREYLPDKYIFISKAYLPEDSIEKSVNSQFYRKSKELGQIVTTPGNVTDYDYILKDLLNLSNDFIIETIAYDPYNATQFVLNAQDFFDMAPFSQGLGSFNKPTCEFERLILQGKIVIDGNTTARWCFQNVEIKEDHNENKKPVKTVKTQKIDIVIAMLECLGVYLLSPRYSYEAHDIDN